MAYVVHHIPGRVRLKDPAIKGNPTKAHEFAVRAAWLKGVCEVSYNARTGSVLVHYDPQATHREAILQALDVRESAPKAEPHVAADAVFDIASSLAHSLLEQWLKRSTMALITRFV